MHYLPGQSTNEHQRLGVACAVGASVTYSLIVIWYVATFPDIGIRALLPDSPSEQQLLIKQFMHDEEDCDATPIVPGQHLTTLNGRPAGNFLLYTHALAQLRSAPLPPNGALYPGANPSEDNRNPPLVEVPADENDDAPTRWVQLQLSQPDGTAIRTYVAVKSMRPGSFLPTTVWFLCQLGILVVALTALWERPADKVVRIFCLMSCVAMPAFVGGFHWWILVATPVLNLPFIFSACLLPPVTLHFFCRFPRENALLQRHGRVLPWLMYAPSTVLAVLIAFTYWSAYVLNGAAAGPGEMSEFQKLVAVAGSLFQSGPFAFDSASVCANLLYALRLFVYAAIMVSSICFGLTVVTLLVSLIRTQNPVERQQASGILVASLFSTIPILYTVYLAFFRKTEFALGQAQIPMFVASGLFMAAYAHGMMRHRLILADDGWFSRRRYLFTSALVTGVSAVTLAVGAVATRIHGLPTDSSLPLKLALFVVLVVAIGFVLWARDRIQSVVDQRFFSEKYGVDKTLKQLNEASGYLTDPSALANITLGTCRDILDASSAAMYVFDAAGSLRLIGADENSNVPTSLPAARLEEAGDRSTVVRKPNIIRSDTMPPLQELLSDLSAELICFLRGESGVDGFIALARKRTGAAYSAEDIAFLQAISQMTGLALHSSRANQNLARLSSELEMKVDRIAEQQRQLSLLRAELTMLQDSSGEQRDDESTPGLDRGEIRGNSAVMRDVLITAQKAAASTATVLVRGESGTGKELLARIVHRNSDRADKPLVTVNCAALAPSLLESELFGHVRGAFTGASSDKEGRFQAAHGGTLFLDEIGDISKETQVKLLRVLQERCFEPVGTNETVHVDVRLIAATNRNLETMISRGEFREDLFYRLNVVSMTLPPLRERREDLIELVFFFLNRAMQKTDKRIRQIESEALSVIERHHWPGNIRELENAIERAVVLADGDTITLKDLPEELRVTTAAVAVNTRPEDISRWTDYAELAQAESVGTPTGSSPQEPASAREPAAVRSVERTQILAALEAARGNKAKAARALNLPRSTFYSKLKKLKEQDQTL